MSLLSSRTRDETGASLVEFAIAFPVLILMMVAIVDLGVNYGNRVQVQHASREAARAGSVSRVGDNTACSLNGFTTSDSASVALACRAKTRTMMGNDDVAVKLMYMGPTGKSTTDFSDSTLSANKYSLVVCVAARTYSLSGMLNPVFENRFHHSRTVVKTGKPATGSFATPGEETPLTSGAHTDDWAWCTADDPLGSE